MKKQFAIPALLLAVAMLASCNSGTTVVPGTSTQSGGASAEAPTTSTGALVTFGSSVAATTAPAITTVPVTYPTLYQIPQISGTHSEVSPVESISGFSADSPSTPFFFTLHDYFNPENRPFTEIKNYLDSPDSRAPSYEVALVTPLEISPDKYYIRVAVDFVYHSQISQGYLRYFKDEMTVYYKTRNFENEWVYKENEIPITTTGGKYVMLLYTSNFIIDGDEFSDDYRDILAFPLTWELDMANVPGSTGDNWNRPPFIGKAEDYYAFGYGDVWERYMAE